MTREIVEVRELKPNGYVIIDEEPCRILSITTSKPGKHGEAKSRVEAIGIFDNQKRSVVYPVKHKVGVPIIDKRTAQVLSSRGTIAQLMDLQTYEVFELEVTKDLEGKLEPGKEVQYFVALGRKKIIRA